MGENTRARLEIKVLAQDGYTALHLWAVTGAGRAVRRQRLTSVRVPLPLNAQSLPDVLRAAARELEAVPADRYPPPPGAPGSP